MAKRYSSPAFVAAETGQPIAEVGDLSGFRRWVRENGKPGVAYTPFRQIGPAMCVEETTIRRVVIESKEEAEA